MKLSVPIYRLKRRAKQMAREQSIPLNEALDRIAMEEGFKQWSLLASKVAESPASSDLLARLKPGDLVLLGARPGHGKTQLGLDLAVQAMKSGHQGVFFTLDYTEQDVIGLFQSLNENPTAYNDQFLFDSSDDISADYVIRRLPSAQKNTVVVIDYLQLLDQKRQNPELMTQIRALKNFARDKGLIMVFIAQIDRSYDAASKSMPTMDDVRLPNPLDLTLFNKACFVHNGELQVEGVS